MQFADVACALKTQTAIKSAVRKWTQTATVWGGERLDKMKNSGMSETMQTLTRKSVCVMLSLLLLLSAVLPVKAAAETAPVKIVRVG